MTSPIARLVGTYLNEVDDADASRLLQNPRFLRAQEQFFAVTEERRWPLDFTVADMREVHLAAALEGHIKGLRVLELGCGSPDPYVLGDAVFRDRYPPFGAELLASLGADVTGIDMRPNADAAYRHITADLTDESWPSRCKPPYDLVVCFSLFNAPGSPFLDNRELCASVLTKTRTLLGENGALVWTPPERKDDEPMPEEEVAVFSAACGWCVVAMGRGMVLSVPAR